MKLLFILLLGLWGCNESQVDLECSNTSNYLCLSDVKFQKVKEYINSDMHSNDTLGFHYTLDNYPLSSNEWQEQFGGQLVGTTATHNNGPSSIIYYIDSLIIGNSGYAGLSEECSPEPYLYINPYQPDSVLHSMVTCTILSYTLLEDSDYYNNEIEDLDESNDMKHCCHRLLPND